MKSIMFFLVSVLFSIFFTGCNDDFGPQPIDTPIVNTSSVDVNIEATTSPILKDGGDDDEPEPMFDVTGVVTQNGTPVSAEVELVAIPESALVDSTVTDSNGGFGFYQVPSGSYNVVVYVDGSVADIIAVNL